MCQTVVTRNTFLFVLFSCTVWGSCLAMDLADLSEAGSRESSPERTVRVRDRSLEPREDAESSREASPETKNLAVCVGCVLNNRDEKRVCTSALSTADHECAKKEMSEKCVLASSLENMQQESDPAAVVLQPGREKQKLSIDTTSGRRTPGYYPSGCAGCLWNDPCFKTPLSRTSPYRMTSPTAGFLQALPYDWCP